MPCNCAEKEAALAYQADSGFNEFIWLLLIVTTFVVVMALLFFFCEILSKTQKLKKKSYPANQNHNASIGLKKVDSGTKSTPGYIIPTISQKVAQQQESTMPIGKPRNLFATPPPPATKSIPVSYISTAPTMASGVSRTIPNYRSLSLANNPSNEVLQIQPQKSSSLLPSPVSSTRKPMPVIHSPLKSVLEKNSSLVLDPIVEPVQKLTLAPSTSVAPPPKPVRHLSIQNSEPSISLRDDIVKNIAAQQPPKSQRHNWLEYFSIHIQKPTATNIPEASVATTASPIVEIQQKSSQKLMTAKNDKTSLPVQASNKTHENSSNNLLDSRILNRLLRGQEESELLFRQIKSLENKLDLLANEFRRESLAPTPEILTQSVQTEESEVKESVSNNIESNCSQETLQINETPKKASEFYQTSAPSASEITTDPKTKAMVTTTTYTITAEVVPKLDPPNAYRTTPIPPLISHRDSLQRETQTPISYDSVEESESLSYKSDSSDSGKLQHIQIQPLTQSQTQKIVELESKNIKTMNESFQNMSAKRESWEEKMLRKQYEESLYETIAQLRTDCQQRIQENENEQRFLYTQRELGLQKEVGSLVSSLQNQDSTLSNLQWKLSSLERNISTIATEKKLLENCAQEMKTGWEIDRKIFLDDKQRLEDLLMKLKLEKQELMSGYEHLIEIKVALDSELSKYKMMVDEEEKRSHFNVSNSVLNILPQSNKTSERRITFRDFDANHEQSNTEDKNIVHKQ